MVTYWDTGSWNFNTSMLWDTVQHKTLAMHRGHRERERDVLNYILWFQGSLLRNQLVSEEAFSDTTYTKGLPAGALSNLKNDVNLNLEHSLYASLVFWSANFREICFIAIANWNKYQSWQELTKKLEDCGQYEDLSVTIQLYFHKQNHPSHEAITAYRVKLWQTLINFML